MAYGIRKIICVDFTTKYFPRVCVHSLLAGVCVHSFPRGAAGVCVHSFAAHRRESAYTVSPLHDADFLLYPLQESAYTVSGVCVHSFILPNDSFPIGQSVIVPTITLHCIWGKFNKNVTNQYFLLIFFAPVLLHACQCVVTYHGTSCSSNYLPSPLNCIVYAHL